MVNEACRKNGLRLCRADNRAQGTNDERAVVMSSFCAALRQRFTEQDAPPSARWNVDETGVCFGEGGRPLFFKDEDVPRNV